MGYHQWELSDLFKRYQEEENPVKKKKQLEILMEYWDDEDKECGIFLDSIEMKIFGIEFKDQL